MRTIISADRRGEIPQTQYDVDPTYELEEMICARVLFNVACMAAVQHSLEPCHFNSRIHGQVYEAARIWHREHATAPPVSLLIQAFDGTQDHDVRPTYWLLEMLNLSQRLTNPVETRQAARSVIDAAYRRQSYSFAGSSFDDIEAALQDRKVRIDRLDVGAESADELLTFYNARASVTGRAPYVVKGLIPAGSTCVLYGPSGSGKTMVAVQLSHCVAAGHPYHGRRVDQGGVVYVCLEGRSDFPKRLHALANTAGEIPPTFALLKNNVVLASDPANDTNEKLIVDASHALAKRSGFPTRLIVVDTLARALAGDNENEAQAISGVLARLDRICAQTGAAVLLIHHPGKDASLGMRGSSALYAAMDTVISIEREKNELERRVTIEKAKDGPEVPLFSFTLKTVVLGVDEDGDEVTSCVVENVETLAQKKANAPAAGTAAAKALTELEHLLIDGRFEVFLGHGRIPVGVRGVKKADWRNVCRKKGLSDTGEADAEKKAFSRAVLNLEKFGLIGTYGDHVWIINGTSTEEVTNDQ